MKIVEWLFRKNAKRQGTSNGFWYDLTEGYIVPEIVLEDEKRIRILKDAIETVKGFEEALEDAELINDF